jgi:sortase A
MARTTNKLLRLSLWLTATFVMLSIFAFAPGEAQATASYVDMGARIAIPSIGVDAPIVQIGIRAFPSGEVTWDTTRLTSQVGYLEGLSWFGEGGNIVLGAHSELANRVPTVFYELDEVAVGDQITITQADTTWTYEVTAIRQVDFRDLSILYPTRSEQLTLMTCTPESLAGGVYNRRTVIIAEPVN